MPKYTLSISDNLLICCGCGAQYDVTEKEGKTNCRICDDPRQFIPPTGQQFTTLAKLRNEGHKNVFEPVEQDDKVLEVYTEPKFGIGQSARLIRTPKGNVLWDLVAYLDEDTVRKIEEVGGLEFVVISHPHFYTTWADWSATFKCPVYTAYADREWLNRIDHSEAELRHISEDVTKLPIDGLTALICGGHFPGSLILHSAPPNTTIPTLFVADTIFSVMSSHNPPDNYFPGKTQTYSFLWSIPNFIPLPPSDILRIWRQLKQVEFKATYGVMAKVTNVFERKEDKVSLKERLLESAKIAVRMMGYESHEIFEETL